MLPKLFLLACLLLTMLTQAQAASLTTIATSPYQWTGLAISQDNRFFVNFPTWRHYPSAKVAEISNGKLQAYPDTQINRKFICIQSVYADNSHNLWILDAAKLRNNKNASGSARLYKVSLTTNKLISSYTFPPDVDLAVSYLNDIRVDEKRQFAYLTDSAVGGIIVLDLQSRAAWRALTDLPQVKADLPGISFPSTGYDNHQTHSDGLALSKDNKTLYFTALTGKTLYSIPTTVLRNKKLNSQQRAQTIKIENAANVPTDGLWCKDNKLYMGDLAKETIYIYDLQAHTGQSLKLSEPLYWVDSLAQDNAGNIYFTTSQINFRGTPPGPYKLYKLEP